MTTGQRALAIFGTIAILTFSTALYQLSHSVPADCRGFVPVSSCDAQRVLISAEVLNQETALGILVSALGTIALIVTVFYSRKATRAAIEASESAKGAIEHARQSSVRELRPYMMMESVRDNRVFYGVEVRARQVAIRWMNVGKTPAMNIRHSIRQQLCVDGLPADFQFPSVANPGIAAVAGPNTWFEASGPDIGPQDIDRILKEQAILHVWGWIEYDGFQPGERYRTELHVSVAYFGSTNPLSTDVHTTVRTQIRFNGMDASCLTRPETKG